MKNFKTFFLFTTFCLLPFTPLFAQMEWICATDSAEWSPRYFHTSVVLDDKIWIIGGVHGDWCLPDVWFSIDGIAWVLATDSTGWFYKAEHTSVIFNNMMWILGGTEGLSYKNDV